MVLHRYAWGPLDSLWHICGRYLEEAGYSDVPTFRDAVVALPQNAAITDWLHVGVGTIVWIPFLS